jgi:hypothetical protein
MKTNEQKLDDSNLVKNEGRENEIDKLKLKT